MKAISLFSGIGGFELAAQLVFGDRYQTFQFVEIDVNAQRVLRSHFPNIPIWCDIRTYHPPEPSKFRKIGFPTIVVGGFPCTDTSSAGKRKGLAGSESGLWWEMYRVIIESGTDFVVIENPEGIVHRGLRTVLGALRVGGYTTETQLISAAELGAPHKRNRVFVVGYCNNLFLKQRQGWRCWSEQIREGIEAAKEIGARSQTEPGFMLLDDGFPRWLDGINFDGWWRENLPPTESGIAPRTFSKRRECVSLYGRSVVPMQAIVAMMRIKFLVKLMEM